jgi:hypothetical protein
MPLELLLRYIVLRCEDWAECQNNRISFFLRIKNKEQLTLHILESTETRFLSLLTPSFNLIIYLRMVFFPPQLLMVFILSSSLCL